MSRACLSGRSTEDLFVTGLQYHRKADAAKQRGGVLDKRAPPKPRLMPQIGETITFWWKNRLVRLSREVDDEGDHYTRQRIVVR